MKLAKNIGRFWLWVGVILLIELAVTILWKRWYRFFPSNETSEIYQCYAGSEGIDAAYVTDYRVNDSLFVDVTLLQATTDSAWRGLMKDFNVMDLSDLPSELRVNFEKSPNAFEFYYSEHDTIVDGDHKDEVCDVFSWSRYSKRFCVFHSVDSVQRSEIVSRLINDITY